MRIKAVNIPDDKKTGIALTYIYGVGRSSAAKILSAAKVSPDKRARDLAQDEIRSIQNEIERHHKVEGELRQIKRSNISRLKSIKAYRGLRHARGLPTRGQRTKSNSRTVRGNVRRTAGSGKRKAELK